MLRNTCVHIDTWLTGICYIFQTQIRFPIGGELVTCHGSKLTSSLKKLRLAWDQIVYLETVSSFHGNTQEEKSFWQSLLQYWVGEYNQTDKTLDHTLHIGFWWNKTYWKRLPKKANSYDAFCKSLRRRWGLQLNPLFYKKVVVQILLEWS